MGTRNIFFSVYLTEDESEKLKAYAARCGLTLSALMRMLMLGYRPQPLPPDIFWAMLDELYIIHDSFMAIADMDFDGSECLREAQRQTVDLVLQLQTVVTQPERMVIACGDHKDLGD